jgi:hypothetical protein
MEGLGEFLKGYESTWQHGHADEKLDGILGATGTIVNDSLIETFLFFSPAQS